MSAKADPVRVYGPEPWATIGGRVWSWWDLWFCVIAVKDHDAELGAMAGELATRIRNNKRARVHSTDSDDARLSHLFDVRPGFGWAVRCRAHLVAKIYRRALRNGHKTQSTGAF